MILPDYDLTHVLDNMPHWELLRNRRLCITGASGFVGGWMVQSFAWANRRLGLNAQLTPIGRTALPTGRFDYALHLAKAPTYWEDIQYTRRILAFAADCGVNRFLYTSSGAVYGRQPPEMNHLAEDWPHAPCSHDPGTAYAQAKRAGEFLCVQHAGQHGFCALIARLFTFSGSGLPLNANFAVGNFLRDVLTGGPVRVHGDGSAKRSYLYAADLAIWLWVILLKGENARPYNVGSPDAVSIAQLARALVAQTVPSVPVIIEGRAVPGAEIYVPSVERARTELALQPLISLEDGVRRMYAGEREAAKATTP